MLPGGVGRWVPVVVVSVAALPVAAVVVGWLTRRRVAGGKPRSIAIRQSVAEVGMVVGTLPWVWMILTPTSAAREIHLVPLVDLAHQLNGDVATAIVQVGGNLLVFAAFGVFAPLRWRLGPVAVLVIAAAGSATLEALQYLLDLGRVSAVDDVMVNAAGAGLAALASRLTRRLASGRVRAGRI
jgi:glycopeptide antibiotics resistance protein